MIQCKCGAIIDTKTNYGICVICGKENYKQTNFERITESPERLAETIDAPKCEYCIYHNKDNCPRKPNGWHDCLPGIIEWLNKEVEI